MLKRLYVAVLLILCVLVVPVVAQKNNLSKQKKVVAELRQSIKNEEKKLRELKKNKASAQELVATLVKQIDSRTALIQETTAQIKVLTGEVRAAERRINDLSGQLSKLEKSLREIIRTAYRNYRYQSHLTYIFSAETFADLARRITTLRVATDYRKEQIDEVTAIRNNVKAEREKLAKRREELAAVKKQLDIERKKLNADMAAAKKSIEQMTAKEKEALLAKQQLQGQLSKEIEKLRALTKGNKIGSSFVSGAKLKVPVEKGVVKRYKGNFAEIAGKEGAGVTAVYEGKVIKIARNKVNYKYDVFIAHGEYITSYANLSEVCVEEGSVVKRNQRIGTIGSFFDWETGMEEFKIIFGLSSPNPKEKVSVSVHFRK